MPKNPQNLPFSELDSTCAGKDTPL
ncbi:hypothetical protein F383_38893 [Gossypium arboreum]|uniref:Uncharacterized protein n=1 Tax=Gossypium arboreum TaxID=29729 RepID=A0A0B0MIX9_GOSAR|nr:hypothetical protein F383_38893 [Gossypium arboreum]